jgi:phosphotriesterase-related protein
MTVLGPVAAEEIGPTLMHEHVLADLRPFFMPPDEDEPSGDTDRPVDLSVLSRLRRRPMGVTRDNLLLSDPDVAVRELRRFTEVGGSALVDCTVIGLGRDADRLAAISRVAGVHIVQGTGIYVEHTHPAWVDDLAVDDIASIFVRDLLEGIGDTGVRAGIIGEIGTSGLRRGASERDGHMTPAEEKVLRAAGRASVRTGAAVSVHLDPRGEGALAVIDVLEEEGVAPERMVMDHMDARPDLAYHTAVAARGVFVEYDHFGREYFAGHMGLSYPSDARRMELLCAMLERGFRDQLLLSQDVCMKIDLESYGGVGYGHLLRELVPILRRSGVVDADLDSMLVENPRRVLTI